MKGSIFLTSLAGTYCAGSKSRTSPAILVGNALASKCVTGPMPLLPASTLAQAVATSLPTGDTMPSPVTTTRRLFMETPRSRMLQETDAATTPAPGNDKRALAKTPKRKLRPLAQLRQLVGTHDPGRDGRRVRRVRP